MNEDEEFESEEEFLEDEQLEHDENEAYISESNDGSDLGKQIQNLKEGDKQLFTLGVLFVVVSTFILAKYPQFIPTYYILMSLILITNNFFFYHERGFHYFLLDYCYFANFMLIFYLVWYPTSPHLFLLNFVSSSGPLPVAVIMWRNSLVFHSMEKLAAIFIHIFPNIVVFTLRWLIDENSSEYTICIRPDDCSPTYWEIFIPHFWIFIFWQVSYLLKTQFVDRDYLNDRPHIQTSYRWLTRGKGNIGRISALLGEEYIFLGFLAWQLFYHMSCAIAAKLMFDHCWIHASLIVFVVLCAMWNGAGFYFERFQIHYMSDVQKAAERKMVNQR